jgi:hypothetical protein
VSGRLTVPRLKSVQRRKKPQRIWRSRLYIVEHREARGMTSAALAKRSVNRPACYRRSRTVIAPRHRKRWKISPNSST